MRVWIDADACPKAAKDQLVKFALKRQFEVVLVAGQGQIKPAFACVRLIVVPSGPDAADDYLVEHAVPGELVICSDVPLADRLHPVDQLVDPARRLADALRQHVGGGADQLALSVFDDVVHIAFFMGAAHLDHGRAGVGIVADGADH
uniref:UPF0178 protein n=1 Tax=Steinernema glaseri TaxID=37863 RepID=A0A1I8AL80_9BILA